ncbi:dihydrofolate reductase [Candidatus Uhrbacteria bacterium]|nr:dihydrofolate reductase [Candidatus Uhrbacteria bacterium]
MISIIVAVSDTNVIGHLNDIPWYLPRDLKNFKALTVGHTVLMGRKTFESIVARIGKPLPDRKNVVITRQAHFTVPTGVVVAASWEDAMQKTQNEDVFVCGGADIYTIALPFADRLILTRVHLQAEGDVVFPAFHVSDWKLVFEEQWFKDEENLVDATYQIYERRRG